MDRGAWQAAVHGVTRVRHNLAAKPPTAIRSLVAQLVKNLPAMQETLVRFLDQEDPQEKGKATTPVFLGFPGGSVNKESACNAED